MRFSSLAIVCFIGSITACAASPEESAGGMPAERRAATEPAPAPATLRYTPQFVLEKVLERKGREFDPSKPVPVIHFASQTPLGEFQDAIEPQWGFRPDVITNAYAVAANGIY